MKCPSCKKSCKCGCKSCRDRDKDDSIRFDFVDGDFIKCPHCKIVLHADQWLDENGQ